MSALIIEFPKPCAKCGGTGLRDKLVRREPGSAIRFWTRVPCHCSGAVAQEKAA